MMRSTGLIRKPVRASPGLLTIITRAFIDRPESMKDTDEEKLDQGHWFLSNSITGMSLYVDRFAGRLSDAQDKLDYLRRLGVNLLHLMPIFESPLGESDGGYAVSDYLSVDPRFGTLEDLKALRRQMADRKMVLMLDIVLNHTSHHHEWARKAKHGYPKLPRLLLYVSRSKRARAVRAQHARSFPGIFAGKFHLLPGDQQVGDDGLSQLPVGPQLYEILPFSWRCSKPSSSTATSASTF